MLRALVSDAIAAGWDVVATWDRRLAIPEGFPPDGLELIGVDDVDAERDAFARLSQSADAACVIAPEIDGELSRRVAVAHSLSRRCLNASGEAVDLCGDKWAFFQHCQRTGIPTIETKRLTSPGLAEIAWPRVLKLRLGAGSQQMRLVTALSEMPRSAEVECRSEFLVQPFLAGQAISVAAIVWSNQQYQIFPVADQFIDPANGFEYGGGRIPSRWNAPVVQELASRVIESVAGLTGYVGIDLLIPDSNPSHPLVVEVNPRLTTSYIGYRHLCQQNLARHWLSDRAAPLTWNQGPITFDSQGVIH